MPTFRHEEQEYATVAALIAETALPTNNDMVFIEATRRQYRWIQGSAATSDGVYVIDQTAATGLGRWMATTVVNTYTGTGISDAMANGQSSTFTVAVAGAQLAKANAIAVTNANTLAANVFVTSLTVTANNTVRVVLENQSGAAVTAQTVNLTVIEF